jgi:CspA family cold shock protein
MLTGRIQSLHRDKGFGFIRPESSGPDVFFHRSVLEANFDSLSEGEPLEYELDEGGDRPRARRVTAEGARSAGRGRSTSGHDSSRSRSAPRERPRWVRPPTGECQRGFVTKLRYEEPHGFISADSGGTEIRFEPQAVMGEKRFSELTVGDYVEFAICAETAGTKTPEAHYVCEMERKHHFPQTQLSRHPKSRRKKPSWR